MWLKNNLINGPFLYLATSEIEFNKAMKRMKVPLQDRPAWLNKTANGTMTSFSSNKGGLVCVVSVNVEGRSASAITGTLIHEAVHVFQKFTEYIGEEKPSPEFEAYSIQSIAQTLIEAYAEKGQK